MTAEYGRYSPLAPKTMSQNRNSAVSSPRTRTTAGTNTGLTDPSQSMVSKSLNIPTPTAPGGHRQTPYGGRTTGKGLMSATGMGRSPVNVNEAPKYGASPTPQSESRSPQNPMVMGDFQNQLGQMKNKGMYGMGIPKGNFQSPPPQGLYSRTQRLY